MNLVVSENSNLASSHKLVHVDQSAQPVVSAYPSRMVPEMPVLAVGGGHHRERRRVLRSRGLR